MSSSQIVVAGYLTVKPSDRDRYLESCHDVVAAARSTDGCLDFAVSTDIVDPSRVNVYERWTDDQSLRQFRGDGPDDALSDLLSGFAVEEFVVGG